MCTFFIIIELCSPKCTLEAKINYEHNLLNIPYYLFLAAEQSSRSLYPLYLWVILMVSVTPYIYFNSYCVNLTCVNLTCAMFVSYCIKRGGGGGLVPIISALDNSITFSLAQCTKVIIHSHDRYY